MRRLIAFWSILGMLCPLWAQTTDSGFMGLQKRIQELIRENASATVRVKAAYRPPKEEEKPEVVIGTGFFISREGHVLTNASIVFKPDRVWIEHQGIAYAARILGEDIASNLALLIVETQPEHFSFLHLADSPELPPPGTFLLRLSAPLDFAPSPAFGIVSGLESRFGQRFFPCAYLRTTIPAGPGDGGAAFLDLSGKLVGIQVGALPEINSSYLLPARAAMRIRDDFLFSGKVTYGWIGFEVREERSIAGGNRLILSLILPGTPAESSGLLPGDVLDTIGEFSIRSIDDLRNAMFYNRVGQYTSCRVIRSGERLDFNVKLAARPENEPLEVTVPATASNNPALVVPNPPAPSQNR